MNKENFTTMPSYQRIIEVNKLLQNHDLKEISKLIGISLSTFSKLMREGDYLYHQGDKQYYPFVRSEKERTKNPSENDSDDIAYIKKHQRTLKRLLQHLEENGILFLDKRIYSKASKYTNKSIRMNTEVYEEFSNFCDEHYPHLKMQDIVAQALLDAIQRYKPEN
ncbi:hypothetical protein MKX67_03700 [Cytobacillus sp. FSL W7-1323]|uniref:hypothetical protein n=1 Tax=Cytobacillus sp. FSL W7-1323 TaxID=2921700 RepID=UPI003158C4DF